MKVDHLPHVPRSFRPWWEPLANRCQSNDVWEHVDDESDRDRALEELEDIAMVGTVTFPMTSRFNA